MLEYIRDKVKPELIVWTGDTMSHNFYEHTPEKVVNDLKNISSVINKYLGDSV